MICLLILTIAVAIVVAANHAPSRGGGYPGGPQSGTGIRRPTHGGEPQERP